MKFETVQSVLAAVCVWLCMWFGIGVGQPLAAATPTIGTAVTRGSLRVDGATTAGNATLFEGATLETYLSSSSLNLASGPRLLLGADSRGRIYGDRLVLERGSGEMHNAAGFRIEARGLTVRTETGHSSARVLLAGNTRVQVAALEGGLRVLSAKGILVAELSPGMALEFDPQAGNAGGAAAEQEKISGCLRPAGGHYLVTDEVTNVTVEVAGPGLDKESGNRVQVTGIMDPTGAPVSGASQYVRVSGVRRIGKGCPANKAIAAGAGGAPNAPPSAGNAGGTSGGNNGGGNNGGAAGAGSGGSSGSGSGKAIGISATALAIIGGVAAAAVVGGLAATGSLSGSSSQSR